jgi:hypothetical protein
MDCIELFPSLDHCIESAAREEFWKLVDEYTESGGRQRELEERIELLKTFLESMDFKKLRSQSEKYLTEGHKVKFVICRKKDRVNCQMMTVE